MNRFFKWLGILTFITAIVFGIEYLYQYFTEISDSLFKWLGIICLVLIIGFGIIRLIFGKKWFIEMPKSTLIRNDLIKATENTLNELPTPSKSTVATLIGHLVYRFTRIGVFAFIVALVPIGILTIQTVLLSRQNEKIDRQNVRLDQQTALLEADRRSAVIFESGNVLDAVARELADMGNRKDSLSNALVGRIIALSRAMKPYKYLDPEADTLIGKAISPERGHLLVSLHNSHLDLKTYGRINRGSSFSKADLRDASLFGAALKVANLKGANFEGANLWHAHLDFADLEFANLRGANLRDAILYGANLQFARLQGADLQGADLIDADLQGAEFSRSHISYLIDSLEIDTIGIIFIEDKTD